MLIRKIGSGWPARGRSLVILLACWIPILAAGKVQPTRRVVILNEVGSSYPLINLIDQGIQSSFDKLPYQVELYREYMETVLFPDPADQQQLRNFFILRYQSRKPDVIIAVGPSPLKFMLETHRESFPGIPVVFCLPNRRAGQAITDPDFTGIQSDIAPGLTVAAALQLAPATKHLVVVGGTASFDRAQQAEVKEQLHAYQNRLDISYFTDSSLPSLLERLKNLPNHSIVLLTPVGRDTTGRTFKSSEIGPLVSAAANAPVFSLTDRYMDHGEVGGDISSGMEQGKLAGTMAARLLNGEKAKDIPSVSTLTAYTFDGRALKRWGFSEKNLPPGSIVLNRPPNFWEAHREYALTAMLVLLAQTLAIVALLWQRARKRKTAAELRKSEEKFSKAFQRSPLAFTLTSLVDYRFLEVNDTFARYTGWTRSELMGQTPLQLNLWVDPNKKSTFLEQLRAEGTVKNMDILFHRKDGQVWTGLVSSELIEVNGEPAALSLIADITEAKRAEEARRESEERFRLVANTAPVMIWVSGVDKLCTYFNQPWLEFTGRSLDQELGNGWAAGVHPEDLPNCMQTYSEAFDRRERFEVQYRLRGQDGEYRWVLDIGVPRFEPQGTFAGYIGSVIDVTERKEAEEALSTVGRRLIEAQEEERSRIGRELHDDMGQRLALLAVELERLDHSRSTEDLHQKVQKLKGQTRDIAADVQALSHQLHSSKLKYLGLAAAAKSFCRELSELHKVQIDFTQNGVPRNLPESVSICLFRILQEALQNAVKYSGTDEFEVDLFGTSADVRLTVRDDGRGFNVDEAIKSHGLGLVSMRERVNLVNGTISIKSKPMMGTQIMVRVPVPVTDRVSELISGAA